MSTQGGEPVVRVDSRSTETQAVDVGQAHGSSYPSLHPGPQSWPSSSGPLTVSSSGYHYDPQRQMFISGDAQGEMNSASHGSTSSNLGVTNAAQAYSGYAPYSTSTISYNYTAVEYQNYYYGYHQPGNDSSTQQVGGDQNSGAAYQPLSTFQNSGSYVGPTSYLGTYYNAGDNQTTAGYEINNYSYQTSLWNDGNYHNYPHHVYSSYTNSATSSTQSSATVSANSLYYQQQYSQWPHYYSQPAPVSGAPGTENISATSLPSAGYSAEGASGGYPYPNNQPPPPGTTSWRDSLPSRMPSSQEKEAVTPYHLNNNWEAVASGIQSHHINQPSYFQKPMNSTPLPNENHKDEQKVLYSQASNLQYSTSNQVPESFQPPLQTVPTTEIHQVSKIQIPTNPRIAPNVGVSILKTQKESSTISAATKPAYVSVSLAKPTNRSSSVDDSRAIIKGTFPPSFCAYVERSFARCKDDAQRSANQSIMKQMITKATADGTLFTKNWDVEPLFPLPNNASDTFQQSNQQSFVSDSSLPTYRRSPSRRKSRWEPVTDEKLGEKLTSVDTHLTDASWVQVEADEKVVDSKSSESKSINGWGGFKFLSSQQQSALHKFGQRPIKKPRFSNTSNVTENGDASSDSDKEQNPTKYYVSSIALANSPEEKKKRENRFKRFEKGQGNQAEMKNFRPKIADGSIYTRKAMLLAKSYEDGCNMAVEDIDWDSLTVKGTCQEIEKRYLRLTSAPDPSTVRPEEVLEKALQMVQTSQKNYLYKCDQLKSIRQDLTVQRIQNALTVKVYETHARLALEAGDLPEYNQCQSQLKRLYAEGIKGCHMEFSAYNLLSIILHSNNKRDLLSSMRRLSAETKDDEAVKHALAVHSAVSSGNYVEFFRLYKRAPNLNTFLMDLYVEKMRFEAMKCMSKSYRPVVPVAYVTHALGFSKSIQVEDSQSAGMDGFEECEEWLRAHGAVLTVDNNGELQLDTKASSSALYMPEPDVAVAHGDATLAVDDFLTRML